MIVERGAVKCTVTQASPDELAWLARKLAYTDKSAFFSGGRARKPLFDPRRNQFPAGLLGAARKLAARTGFHIDVVDARPPAVEPVDDAMARLAWLHDFQQEAVEVAVAEGNGILQAPTGSGKGEIIVGIVGVLPCRHLVVVPSGNLMHDIAERIEARLGEKVGRYGDGHKDTGTRVVVATFASMAGLCDHLRLARVRRFFEAFPSLIVDEVHTTGADGYWKVAMALSKARYRIGLSGTPLARSDRRGALVLAATGDILFTITAKQLHESGLIAMPTMNLLQRPIFPERVGSYAAAYEKFISNNAKRDRFTLEVIRKAPKPVVVFVELIEHGERLERMVRRAGMTVELVTGKRNVHERLAAQRRVAHGDVDVLVSNVVFRTGMDLPELQSVVFAQGGKSHISALQGTGRGMRVRDKQGRIMKTEFPVYDITERGCGCRYTDANGATRYQHTVCKWFDTHAGERRKAYRKAGYPVVEVQT